jgi:hypothetical protein
MTRVFISYRRDDSAATAGHMAELLSNIPAIKGVFLDVENIESGEDFQQRIQSSLDKCSHVLVLIGPDWSGPVGTDGKRRIFEPHDFVRWEARLSLQSQVKVIPILLDAATMPRAADLPEDLHALPRINAFSLRTSHFRQDMDDLLDVVLGNKKERGSRWAKPRLTVLGVAARLAGGLVSAGALVLGVAVVSNLMTQQSLSFHVRNAFGLETTLDAQGPLMMMISAVLVAGAIAPFLPRLLMKRR